MSTKRRTHARPEYQKNKPYHLVKIPYVATTGSKDCPHEYNNWLHASVHSLLAALQCSEMKDVQYWMKQARRQLNGGIKAAAKHGASVPKVGATFDYPEMAS